MDQRPSRSPSPPPPAPVQQTPGPRAAALQKVFSSALTASIRANTYPNFASCFPTPAKYCPTALEGVWKQLNSRLEEECAKDFEKILEERNVVEGLNQWDQMIEEARRRKDRAVDGEEPSRPLHTLTAEELFNAHLGPYLVKASDELNEKLRQTQHENTQMMNTIQVQRAEIERLLGGLETIVKDIEGSVQAMQNENNEVSVLRNEVWQMEQEVNGSR